MHTLTDLEHNHVFIEEKYVSVIDTKFLYEVRIPEKKHYQCAVMLTMAKRNFKGRNSKTPLVKTFFLVFE